MYELEYTLAGLEPSCTNCGLHLHTGISCADLKCRCLGLGARSGRGSYVGPHYYATTADPWSTVVGDTGTAGTSTGSFTVAAGLPLGSAVSGVAVQVGAEARSDTPLLSTALAEPPTG